MTLRQKVTRLYGRAKWSQGSTWHTVGQNEGSGGNRILYGSRDSDLVLKLFPRYNSGILATYK